jgi:regulator of protease activity HflC (stomatin/prohibitin superfamily)
MSLSFALLPLLFAIALIAIAFKRVPDGEAWTVHRFGRHTRTLRPGWWLVWPGLDRIARHVSLIGHHVAVPVRALGAADASADLYYQILDPVQTGNTLESVDDIVIREADDAVSVLAARLPQQTGWSAAAADALKQEMNSRVTRMGLRVIRCALHTV